ncbi:hypothetical protein QVD17_07804 [Tagetes erecta]|uniref:BZIP domain-containing protein n=1 Tax=Tagetes erecta TaxID=13708 RepID=A0AAD8KY71_TARER|nr:hypothetical protein QVD17_07804 [Tagetes erecta]
MDDIWNDISTLSTPTTNHFHHFFPPPETSGNLLPSTAVMLTSSNSDQENPNKRPKPNPPLRAFTAPAASPPEHTEKFRRLMKNRESAARSRARKQARADELEHEVMRLSKENAKLKRLQKQACVSHLPKESRLLRSNSAPF